MGYKVGDMVVYPRHGAAKVEAITERTVKGITREYLQLMGDFENQNTTPEAEPEPEGAHDDLPTEDEGDSE